MSPWAPSSRSSSPTACSSPRPSSASGEWAEAAAVTDYFGLTAEQLNDDRLGRALERLDEHAADIQAALVLKAIEHFELDVTQIHYDLTTVELYGAYEVETAEGQPPPTPLPTYGRTKSGRKHVKQVQLGLDVTGDGGVPVGHLPLDGNAGEVTSHLDNLKLLARTLPKGKLLYIADTKLDAPEEPAGDRRPQGPVPLRRRPLAAVAGAIPGAAGRAEAGRLLPREPGQAARRRSATGTRPSRSRSTWRARSTARRSGSTTG